MERYLLTWLSAENLNEFYEPFALLRDEKAAAILPKLASDLSVILFAISVDIPELNVASSKPVAVKPEPIIAIPESSKIVKATVGKNCRSVIDDFEETVKSTEISPQVVTEPLPLIFAPETSSNYIDQTSTTLDSSSTSSIYARDDDTISHSSSSSDDYDTAQPSSEPELVINKANQIDNEVMMQKQRERIMELEGQVLDLTLENSRLKNLLSSTRVNTLASFQVSIPRAVLQKTKTKNYYVYEINLRTKDGSESWTIFKRYRDFYSFHKQLKKQHLQIKVLDFPPKKKIGNLDFDFVEQRRQRLQLYIRHVIQNLPELSNCDSRKLLETKCSFFKS